MASQPRDAGYTALAAMLLVGAAMALALIALEAGQGARVAAATGNNADRARTIAEAGLERTRAYLGQVLATQVDLDVALDPKLDDDCTTAPFGNTSDDNLPPFADGAVVVAGPGARSWLQVPYNGGAYLVRIDDDDDDQLNPTGATVGNHVGALACAEGSAFAGISRENTARDTNRTVVVTAVGIYPGTDAAHALAVKTVRATVGPAQGAGVIAGGPIDMHPGSDDINGSIISTGDVDVNAVSGTVRTSGACTNPGPPVCQAGAVVPPLPKVDPWDVSNAPTAGSGVNFYYAAYVAGAPVLYQWNYFAAGCADPRAWGRICYPAPDGADADQLGQAGTLCTTCWAPVLKQPGNLPQPATQIVVGTPSQPVWDVAAYGAAPWTGCTGADPDMYPGSWTPMSDRGTYWDALRAPNAKFTWHGATPFGVPPSAPSGIWMIAGDVEFNSSTACTDQASIIALGDITLNTGHTAVNLIPAAPKPYILLAGRDLQLHGGNGGIDTGCPPVPAAVMVHEQLEFQSGHDAIDAQVVVENADECSGTVPGPDAILGHGNDQINAPAVPPIGIGPSASLLDFQESAF
jgi:hypothetical protein